MPLGEIKVKVTPDYSELEKLEARLKQASITPAAGGGGAPAPAIPRMETIPPMTATASIGTKGVLATGAVGGLAAGTAIAGIPAALGMLGEGFAGVTKMLEKIVKLLSLILKPLDMILTAFLMPLFWAFMPLIRLLRTIMMPYMRAYIEVIKQRRGLIEETGGAALPLVWAEAAFAGTVALFSNLADMLVGALALPFEEFEWDEFVSSLDWTTFMSILDWVLFIPSITWSLFISLLNWGLYVVSLAWDSFINPLNWGDYVSGLVEWLQNLLFPPPPPIPEFVQPKSTTQVGVHGELVTTPEHPTGFARTGESARRTYGKTMDEILKDIGKVYPGFGVWNPQTGMISGAQEGGFVKETGLAVIHKGETITPANAGETTINVNLSDVTVRDARDIKELARALADEIDWQRTGVLNRGI